MSYGRGGTEPTITDANLVLGRLGAELLGGALRLDRTRAAEAIEARIARPLGLSLEAAAHGMLEIQSERPHRTAALSVRHCASA